MYGIRITLVAFNAALALSGLAVAQTGGAVAPVAASSSTDDLAHGEVRKVDKDGKRLTLDHGPLKSVDMPGMTMAFRVKDDAMLDMVKVGDKVRFLVEKIDNRYVVTRLEAAAP